MNGFQKHHRSFTQKTFKNKSGKAATNKKENPLNEESHWNTVFNHHASYDEKIIEEINQHPVKDSLGTTPNKNEIKKSNIKNEKRQSTRHIPTYHRHGKNLPSDALDLIIEAIQEFWHRETDFKVWHITKLNILYKGKGDQQELNNYRGICLKETCAKIISTIVSSRLLQHLKTFGSKLQFGMVGCQEAQQTLEKALHLRCQHGLETFALFVDLIKAFDTVQHPLLSGILNNMESLTPKLK
jgi:hypothetical protein